jgi:hypothetical protein
MRRREGYSHTLQCLLVQPNAENIRPRKRFPGDKVVFSGTAGDRFMRQIMLDLAAIQPFARAGCSLRRGASIGHTPLKNMIDINALAFERYSAEAMRGFRHGEFC